LRAQIQIPPKNNKNTTNTGGNCAAAAIITVSAGTIAHSMPMYPATIATIGLLPATYEHANGSCCQP
jgi:hypothetical protein